MMPENASNNFHTLATESIFSGLIAFPPDWALRWCPSAFFVQGGLALSATPRSFIQAEATRLRAQPEVEEAQPQ